jgi:hypothetical protein
MDMLLTAAPELQSLIDLRLDLVDRVLQDARLSRAERTGILEELAGQIQEQLDRRSSEPTREDLLAVLAELDPPEAFQETFDGESDRPRPQPRSAANTSRRAPAAAPVSALGLWAGGLVGGVALATGLLLTTTVWLLPEAVLVIAGVIQLGSLVGSGLGLLNLVWSGDRPLTGLEKTVSISAIATAPLALMFVLALVIIFAEAGDFGEMFAFVIAGFVGGAWMHGAWMCGATAALMQRRGANNSGR